MPVGLIQPPFFQLPGNTPAPVTPGSMILDTDLSVQGTPPVLWRLQVAFDIPTVLSVRKIKADGTPTSYALNSGRSFSDVKILDFMVAKGDTVNFYVNGSPVIKEFILTEYPNQRLYALLTLEEAKAWLQITNLSDDAFIDGLIAAVSAQIENFLGRKLKARDYVEELNGNNLGYIMLEQYPIVSVSEINVDSNREFKEATALTVTDFVIHPEEGRISVKGDSRLALNIFPIGERNIRVTYRGGYDPLPADISLAAMKTLARMYRQAKQGADGFLSETVLGYSTAFEKIDLPEDIKFMLMPYKKHLP